MSDFDPEVWAMVQEIGTGERHFNNLQHNYRALASTWLLAMLAGTGYVYTEEMLPLPPGTLSLFLGFASLCGFTLIWLLDLRVYHLLLDAYFAAGLRLEEQHKWLPRIRHNMLTGQGGETHGVLNKVVRFYMGCGAMAVLVLGCPLVMMEEGIVARLMVTAAVIFLWGFWAASLLYYTRSPLFQQGTR